MERPLAHDFVSALQVDNAVFFTALITVTAFVPLFTMQGVEGQIFGPMARTYGLALAGALLSTSRSRRCWPRCYSSAGRGNRNRHCTAFCIRAIRRLCVGRWRSPERCR